MSLLVLGRLDQYFLHKRLALTKSSSVGFLVMIVPLYQAELAHPSIRGRVTALQQFMLGIGSLVASWTTYGTNKNFADTDSRQWRIALGIQIIPAGILALLIMLFPESPSKYGPLGVLLALANKS